MARNGWSRAALTCLAASALLWPSLSSAQVEDAEIGSMIRKPAAARIPDGVMSEKDRARATLIDYSTCLVRRTRSAVERWLAMPAMSEEAGGTLVRLARSQCLFEGELKMKRSLLRSGLYIALYKADYGSAPKPLSAQPVDYSGDAAGLTTRDAMSHVALREFAACIVRTDPQHSRVAVLAQVGSASDSSAYVALSEAMGGCMPQGMKLTFDKAVLHGLLGEALYRETRSG